MTSPTVKGESRRLGESLTRIEKRWALWLAALLIWLVGSAAALLQQPHPEPMRGLAGLDRWLYPEQANGWRRLPDLSVPINDVHVFADGSVIVVGNAGLIARSDGSGRCWTLQGPAAPPRLKQNSCGPDSEDIGTLWNEMRDLLEGKRGDPSSTVWLTPQADLRSLAFIDGQTGWAVGDDGTILHTRDGGTTWSGQASGTDLELNAVALADAQTGWAVGDEGTILQTRDGGTTWTLQASGINEILIAVAFFDAQTGWAVGQSGTILQTRDGGTTWTPQANVSNHELTAVVFADAQLGCVVGDEGTILRTRDGGTTWTAQASGTVRDLTAVAFVNAQTAWAVGQSGTILQTRDGGTTWTAQASGIDGDLTAVAFANAQIGWAVGDDGTTLQTRDGGTTWTPQAGGSNQTLTAVSFADAQTGWAVGLSGTILQTRDGGTTWTPQKSGTFQTLVAVTFAGAQLGWVVGDNGTILRTRDGGTTWMAQASGTDQYLTAVAFADAQTGWAVGRRGTILRTRDGGTTWRAQTSGTDRDLTAVAFADVQTGWALMYGGTTLQTRDGGTTWTPQASGINEILTALAYVDAQTGWAVGLSGAILQTRDGGTTWTAQASGIDRDLTAVVFADAQIGWVVGDDGTILQTRDGGTTWTPQASGTDRDLTAVAFADAQTAWAVGRSGTLLQTRDGGTTWAVQASGTDRTIIDVTAADVQTGWALELGGTTLQTRDGGTTWAPQASGFNMTITDVAFFDAQTGWAVGLGGTILQTRDGGTTWTPQESGTFRTLAAVTFADAQTGWVVGRSGTILRTRDGGATWAARASSTNRNLIAVAFADARTGWAVGDEGTILRTHDGGTTWMPQAGGTAQLLTAVAFVDAQTGWSVGDEGTILQTRNGGTTWMAQASGTDQRLTSVAFIDSQTGWVVGREGTILHTRDGGTTWTAQASGTDQDLIAVALVDKQTGWAVGVAGIIISLTPWTSELTYVRVVARWYWLLLAVVAVFIIAGYYVRRSSTRLSELIGGRLLSDRPIDDRERLDPESPLLASADQLSAFLRNRETVAPVSLAITGEWGAGKSSLMKLLHADLTRYGFAPAWFNAWHHERGEHLLASLYSTLRRHWCAPGRWVRLGTLGSAIPWLLSSFRLLLRRIHASPWLAALWVVGIVLVVTYAADELGMLQRFVGPGDETQLPPSSLALWGLLVIALAALFSPLMGIVLLQWWMRKKLRSELAHLLDVDGLHAAESKAAARERFAHALEDWSHVRGDWRFVVFIDDLDRCAPATVLELLELSNFLATTGKVICVIALSPSWVHDCVQLHYQELFRSNGLSESSESKARRYLEKMFTMTVQVPELANVDIDRLMGLREADSVSDQEITPENSTLNGTGGSTLAEHVHTAATYAKNVMISVLSNIGLGWRTATRLVFASGPWLYLILLMVIATSFGLHLEQKLDTAVKQRSRHVLEWLDETACSYTGRRCVEDTQNSKQPASTLPSVTATAEGVETDGNQPEADALSPDAGRPKASSHVPIAIRPAAQPGILPWRSERALAAGLIASGLLIVTLILSLLWQLIRSLRGTTDDKDAAGEQDSPEFIGAVLNRRADLVAVKRSPRDLKRVLNLLRYVAIRAHREFALRHDDDRTVVSSDWTAWCSKLRQLQFERDRLGAGLRRVITETQIASHRKREPSRADPINPSGLMHDVVAVTCSKLLNRPELADQISPDRRARIADLLPPSEISPGPVQ